MGLNREAPTPLYHQLKMLILKEIEAGVWKPDQQLPTEERLAGRFGVSKITVRQALRELVQLGRVRREQGRGTFVQRPPLQEGPRRLTSFTGEMREHGLVPVSRVLEKGIVAAPAGVGARLGIAEGEAAFRLRRLRFADGQPMGVQTAWLPAALVAGIERVSFEDVSLYEILDSRYQLRPAGATETYVAVVVTAEEAALLHVPPGTAALAGERLTVLADGRPLEYVDSIMRSDRYKVVLELVR